MHATIVQKDSPIPPCCMCTTLSCMKDTPVWTQPRRVTARDLAARWANLAHLTREEAAAFVEDLTCIKVALRSPGSPWE
jgi:hypothetical protein